MIPANQVITSLAILLVNWDQGKTYLDNFVPFVGRCIVLLQPEVVSIQDLQQKMLDEFGFRIPQNSLKTILKKSERKGYIHREDNAYIPNYEVLQALDVEPVRQEILRNHDALLQKLIKFASERYSKSFTNKEGERLLLSYIKQHDIELLGSVVAGEPIPEIEGQLDRTKSYLIHAFVRHTYESDPEGFKYLDTIVKGHMLSNALIFPDLGKLERRFHRTSVYCDTALLLRTLGYEGSSRQAACRELRDLLHELGADIRCFRDTRYEIYNILYACKLALGAPDTQKSYGPAFRYFSESGFGPADLELEMATLDKKIERLGIRIVEKPEYAEEYQIDESRLSEILDAELKYSPDREKALEHDVDCLSAIYRLRKGQSFYSIEDCSSIFVTPNNTLCRVSAEFFQEEGYIRVGSIPMAITDYALTNVLWLKKPMAAPNLPQKYITAECYAAMEPGEHLWRKYLDKISQLKDREEISGDDYYLLRYTQEARNQLTDITMGDDEAFVEGTTQEILERVRQSIREQDLTELATERKKREEAERKLRLEQTIRAEREETLNLNVERISRRMAFFTSRIVFGILEALLVSGAVYSLVGPQLRWWNLTLFIAAVTFVVFTLYSLFSDRTVKDWLYRFENLLQNRIQRILKRWFVP